MSKDAISRRSMIGGCAITVAAGIGGYLVAHDKWSATTKGTATSYTSSDNGQFLAHLSQVPGGGGGLILGSGQGRACAGRGRHGTWTVRHMYPPRLHSRVDPKRGYYLSVPRQ